MFIAIPLRDERGNALVAIRPWRGEDVTALEAVKKLEALTDSRTLTLTLTDWSAIIRRGADTPDEPEWVTLPVGGEEVGNIPSLVIRFDSWGVHAKWTAKVDGKLYESKEHSVHHLASLCWNAPTA